MRSLPRRLFAVIFVLLAAVAASCSTSDDGSASRPTGDSGPPPLYVAVGASETVGVGSDQPERDAWPQVFLRTALPPETRFVNLGIPGATAADALQGQVPEAESLRPDVVTVWLNANDLIAAVTPAAYERDLDGVVGRLRRAGADRVLVANTPELDTLPVYVRCRETPRATGCSFGAPLPPPDLVRVAVAAYNAAIARVAATHGATLVDLHAAAAAARVAGTHAGLVAADGFHPSTAGHVAVAAAFRDAYVGATRRP